MHQHFSRSNILTLVVAALLLNACKKENIQTPTPQVTIEPPAPIGFMVVGYFPSYRTVAEYPDRMFRMCNVINYAFANVNVSNTINISNTIKMDSVIKKGKANGAKVFLSIAGDHNTFKEMSNTVAGRTVFPDFRVLTPKTKCRS